jgi:hypothetical protein
MQGMHSSCGLWDNTKNTASTATVNAYCKQLAGLLTFQIFILEATDTIKSIDRHALINHNTLDLTFHAP